MARQPLPGDPTESRHSSTCLLHFPQNLLLIGEGMCSEDHVPWGPCAVGTVCRRERVPWGPCAVGTGCSGDRVQWGPCASGDRVQWVPCAVGTVCRGDRVQWGLCAVETVCSGDHVLWGPCGFHSSFTLEKQWFGLRKKKKNSWYNVMR